MLLYFDIFEYPLSADELKLVTTDPTSNHLQELIEMGMVTKTQEWYHLSDKMYLKRILVPSQVEQFAHRSKKSASLIAKFPFVRGVYVSGSISKGWADENTDVDYFIITTPNRLWLCRSMLILYKKLFLLNSRKYFCLNYFIDYESIEIEEKNIFTATEIRFLQPMVNLPLYNQFIKSNEWIAEYGYNIPQLQESVNSTHSNPWLKRVVERMFSGKLGEWLDIRSMKTTLSYWKDKFPEMGNKDFEINFKSKRTVSKHHPGGFQKKVLKEYTERLAEFESKTGIQL